MNRIGYILFTVFLCSQVWAQSVKATINKNQILIGDHVNLDVEINPGKGMFEDIDLHLFEGSDTIEIIKIHPAQKRPNSSIFDQALVITSFDSGTHYIPPVIATIQSLSGKIDTLRSNTIPLYVNNVKQDSIALAPIKPIFYEEATWKDYLFIIIPILILLLLGVFLWYWQKRNNETVVEKHIEVPKIPADIKALGALSTLEADDLVNKGMTKEYEVRISEILRRYLEEKLRFPALEWTTKEIVNHLGGLQTESIPIAVIQDTLELSDMVKFAKVRPDSSVHLAQMKRSRTIIECTRNLISEEE